MDDRPFRNIAELMKLNLEDTSGIVIVQKNATDPTVRKLRPAAKTNGTRTKAGSTRCMLPAILLLQ